MHSDLVLYVLSVFFQPHVVLPVDTDILHGFDKVHHNVQYQPRVLALGRYVIPFEPTEDPIEL